MDPAQEQIDDLIGRLRGDRARDREMAVRALARIGARAVPKLLLALQDEDWNVRRHAASVFALAPSARAVPLLCELARESDWEVRWAAVAAMKAAYDPRATEALVHRLGDYHPKLRALAAEALLTMDEARALTREDLCGPSCYKCAMNGLRDADARVRRASVLVLGRLGDPEAISVLAEILTADQAGVAAEAATALGRLGTADAIGPLFVAARSRQEALVQCAACRSLGLIGGEKATGCLTAALRSRSTEVRRTAALELLHLSNHSPSVALLPALRNLRWCLAQGWWLGDDDAAIYGEAIRSIERATRTLRDLPVPSGGGALAGMLPVPASGERRASMEPRNTSQLMPDSRDRRGPRSILAWLRARLRRGVPNDSD
jgi:HEAT repeat protein